MRELYTIDEIEQRIASHDYGAELMLQHAMVHLRSLRAEKQEFRAEATRWAEEAGRLKALLHDAQRDAGRYRWIRDCTKDGCVESAILDHARYAEVKMGKRLDAAIDAAMATEREVLNG